MDFDRQAIERKDFPIGRRGYDAASVDEHLRALAAEFEELQRGTLGGGGDMSLASSAGNQVQSIIEAAEAAAAEIERLAQESARHVREAADAEAERTREDAVVKARAHIAGVAQVAASLLERVNSMDGEVSGLVESLRSGAGRLAADLTAVEANMGELYDAASGGGAAAAPADPIAEPEPQRPFEAALDQAIAQAPAAAPPPAPVPQQAPVAAPPEAAGQPPGTGGDIDGARLVALNMALNGESRTETERYLAENFQLPDRLKLIDEVYAAVEG